MWLGRLVTENPVPAVAARKAKRVAMRTSAIFLMVVWLLVAAVLTFDAISAHSHGHARSAFFWIDLVALVPFCRAHRARLAQAEHPLSQALANGSPRPDSACRPHSADADPAPGFVNVGYCSNGVGRISLAWLSLPVRHARTSLRSLPAPQGSGAVWVAFPSHGKTLKANVLRRR